MSFVIVPNVLRDSLYDAIDAALENCPDAVDERDDLYRQLLAYYNEHGRIPEFTLAKRETTP